VVIIQRQCFIATGYTPCASDVAPFDSTVPAVPLPTQLTTQPCARSNPRCQPWSPLRAPRGSCAAASPAWTACLVGRSTALFPGGGDWSGFVQPAKHELIGVAVAPSLIHSSSTQLTRAPPCCSWPECAARASATSAHNAQVRLPPGAPLHGATRSIGAGPHTALPCSMPHAAMGQAPIQHCPAA
jgi:hypothetical protein